MFSTHESPCKLPSLQQSTPQWELILDLLAHLLDPKTLATASCVSRSWHSILSSNHLWKPLCLTYYPSITNHTTTTTTTTTYIAPRRLFALLQSSSSRRHRSPCMPRISLNSLIFSVDIFHNGYPVFSIVKLGEELTGSGGDQCKHQVFRFDIEVEDKREIVTGLNVERETLRVVWNVVMKGWRGAFLMMDRVGKGRVVGGVELWFSEDLPGPACCSSRSRSAGGAGLVAELGLVFGSRRYSERVEKVSLGLMSGVEWRYLSVDDGLLYLQPFLLPSYV